MENLNQIIEEIRPAMEKMAEQLGVASEFLWGVLIKQQYINGIFGIGWCILGIAILGLLAWSIKKWGNVLFEMSDGMVILIWVIVGTLGILALILGFREAINHLVNPEYQAIKDIFEFIRGSTGN